MKNLFLLFIFLFSLSATGQEETTIEFTYPESQDLILANELNGITIINFISSDKSLKGKKFFISIQEYKKGEIIKDDSLNLICKNIETMALVGQDTFMYLYNSCDHITWMKNLKEFKIAFAGKFNDDTFKLIIKYPGINLTRYLNGNSNYMLRTLNISDIDKDGEESKTSTNVRTPIFSYAPPVKIGENMGNYCILDTESVENWYAKFNIEHFYIISLEIK